MKEQLKNEIKERLTIMGVAPMFRKQAVNGDVLIFERQNAIFSDVHYSLKLNKTQEPYIDLALKVEELKLRYNFLPYMVQLTHTSFGDLYSIFGIENYNSLGIDKNEDVWEYSKADLKDNLAFVYVYNATDEDCSEFGTIGWQKGNMGGIIRTA